MIDINYYRQAESIAKNNLPTWVINKKYNLDIFQQHGFPIRLDNIQQTFQIFDTMQENRFDTFMKELGGLTDSELDIFIDASINNIKFQKIYFQSQTPFVPFDTLMNTFVLYHKINRLFPNIKKIFEIGPGTGSFSFFLNNLTKLQEYSYTDACESFYLLQNNINTFLFQEYFSQKVINNFKDKSFNDCSNENYSSFGLEKRHYIPTKNNNSNHFICNAYPWWKLGEFNDNNKKYDLIISNANLREFSEGALIDYLKIMQNKLTDDGFVFAHCIGWGINKSRQYLYDMFYKYNFAIICLLNESTMYTCPETNSSIEKQFMLDNLILINNKHSLFKEYYKHYKETETISILPKEEFIHKCFFYSTSELKEKIIYTKEELTEKIIAKLGNS